jgi:hypothetical protein
MESRQSLESQCRRPIPEHESGRQISEDEDDKHYKDGRQLGTNIVRLHAESDSDEGADASAGVWFWNSSANESESDTECEGMSDRELDSAPRNSIAGSSSSTDATRKLQWKREGDDQLRGGYGQGSRSTNKRARKMAQELRNEASKMYSIADMWKRQRDLGLVANSLESEERQSACVSELPRGTAIQSNEEIRKAQRINASKELERLLGLVTEQEKKYGERLLPHGNFYRRHVMVRQFLEIQLGSQRNGTRRTLSLSVAQCFGRGHATARNIVKWENSWVNDRIIPKRQGQNGYSPWMDDEELKESIRDFARKEGDSKYFYLMRI